MDQPKPNKKVLISVIVIFIIILGIWMLYPHSSNITDFVELNEIDRTDDLVTFEVSKINTGSPNLSYVSVFLHTSNGFLANSSLDLLNSSYLIFIDSDNSQTLNIGDVFQVQIIDDFDYYLDIINNEDAPIITKYQIKT